ncbi:MAG: TraR/DksA C4-type zinc finger protein [Myxococcales bacterium]|nr:TraR/DksA C4-type zinc finger protein [Myxococcales bacterium]
MNIHDAQVVLQEQLDTLVRRAKRIGDHQHEIGREVPQDWDELAQYRQGDEVVSALDGRTRYDISQIRAALTRVRQGTWGQCVRCHDKIGKERLSRIPATPLCAACAVELESHTS